nr:PREDICTED: uncharacterized protein LOC103567563 isoform X1 [Equus przewalskii]
MNFLIIRGGRKALGPLGLGGARPGPAPRARPRHPLPGQLWAAPRGRGPRPGASSYLFVWLSVRLSEALAQLTILHQLVKCNRREASSLFGSPEPTGSFSKTPRPREQSPASGKAASLDSNSVTQRGKPPEPSGSFPWGRDRRHDSRGGSRFEPLRKQIIGALSERAQQMRPPSNASFTTADPRADGQADSRPRGAYRAPSARAACLPGAPECKPPGCARCVWMDMRACPWMVTEQAKVLVHMRVCHTSVLQGSALVQAHEHTRAGRVCCECLEMAEMRLFEGAQRKGCCT